MNEEARQINEAVQRDNGMGDLPPVRVKAVVGLLPCPFCGGRAVMNHGGFGECFVTCANDNCGGRLGCGIWFTTAAQAMDVWNRRPNASLDRPAASAGTVGGVVVPGVGPVFVCESCLRGEHQSYGCDHRNGPEDGRDCKNLSPDGKRQCLCNPDWPELTEAIHRHNARLEEVK
jgi:hypothetical protein